MKQFDEREIEEALAYADAGGQALHLHSVIVDWDRAPECFKRDVRNGLNIGHLFDRDEKRLIKTARMIGVKVIKVERRGRHGQHIDLCGRPLANAVLLCIVGD